MKTKKYSNLQNITPWIANESDPAETLKHKGLNALRDSELLTLILPGLNKEQAENLLNYSDNNLKTLAQKTLSELKNIPGLGERRAITIISLFELARRYQLSNIPIKERINKSEEAYNILYPNLAGPYEQFFILLLDRSNKVIAAQRISEGGVSGTVVDPKKIFKIALDSYA